MQNTVIEEALDVLRPGLAADGFSLKLGTVESNGAVQVLLEAGPESCLECLVPENLMVQIIENAIRQRDDSLDHVKITRIGFERYES